MGIRKPSCSARPNARRLDPQALSSRRCCSARSTSPNPLLAPVTGAAALIWCSLYDRHPNIIPLALSHGLGTLALRYAFDEAITGLLRIGAAYLRQ